MRSRPSLIALLVAATLFGSAGLAAAAPPDVPGPVPSTGSAALLQGPVTRVAASEDEAPPADVLGSPASGTIVRSDQLLITDRVNSGTNPMSAQRVTLDAGLAFGKEGAKNPAMALPLRHRSYPTAAGRFLDSAADKVLAFRHHGVNGRGLWTLSDISSAADRGARTTGKKVTTLEIGRTYTIGMQYVWPLNKTVRHVAASGSDWGVPITYLPVSDDDNHQWSVIRASDPDHFRLVSLSDGTCLDALGGSTEVKSKIGTFPCVDGAQNQEWRTNANGHLVNRRSGLTATTAGDTLVQQADAPDSKNWWMQQWMEFTETVQPQGVIPTVSFEGDADPATPYDLAAGDLDRAVDSDSGGYHDEAVVAWGGNHQIFVRVVDYSRPEGDLTISEPDKELTASIGGPDCGSCMHRPGSLNVAVGDFNGDSRNEIAVTWQDAASLFHVAFLSYGETDGRPALTVIKPDQPLLALLKDAPTPRRTSGMADLVAGDFDGSGRDSLALGYAGGKSDVFAKEVTAPFLAVVRLDAGLKPAAAQWGSLAEEAVMYLADPAFYNSAETLWTENGIRLAAGVFDRNEPNLHRRQIASVARIQPLTNAQSSRFSGALNTTRQVVIHEVTTPDPGKPQLLGLSGLTAPLQLPDDGQQSRPVSIAAGGFLGQGDPGDVPVWGLAVTQSEGGLKVGQTGPSYVQMVGVDNAKRELTRPYRTVDHGERGYTLTSYDQAGESLMLGAPVRFTYANMPRVNVVAAQPPAHSDWLDGGFVNVSRSPELNVSMSSGTSQEFSSTRTDTHGHTMGVGEKSKFTAGDTIGIKGMISIGGSITVGQKMEKAWESEEKTINSNSHEQETTITSATADDDIVSGQTKTTYIYRYPILNKKLQKTDGTPLTDPSCPQACYGSYEISLPGPVVQGSFGGRDVDWYTPTWQNGNALSYPDASSPQGAVPAGDTGTYSYVDDNNVTQSKNGMLFDASNSLGSVKHSAELKITDKVGGGHDRTSKTTLANSAYIKLTEKVELAAVDFEGEQRADFKDETTHSSIAVGETKSSTANAFALEMPQIDGNKAYQIRTAYYYDKSGAQKVVHGVDLQSSTQGREWWTQNYGRAADPALNLPNSTVMVKNDVGVYDEVKWNAGATRQRLRGFDVLDDQGEISQQNPATGAKVRFRVQVHNYSLKAAGAFPVRWFAVPVDDLGLKVTGAPQPIGGNLTVSGIAARGMVSLTSPEWTARANGGDDQHWRIFVQLNPEGSLQEVHPLEGSACPEESVNGGKPPVDPMTGEEEELGCGQNNQGFGTVVVSPALPAGPRVGVPDLDGSTLVDGSTALLGDSPAQLAQVVVGQTVTGVVRAASAGVTREHQTVVVYDGDPDQGGQGIASTTLHGTAAGSGQATFSWTPTTPGTHVLHQKLVGRTAAEGHSTQTLTVEVLAHGPAARLAVTPASPATTPGRGVAVTVKAFDAQNNLVGDVTRGATLAIGPDGACRGTLCTPVRPGAHTITATHAGLTATAPLGVDEAVPSTVVALAGNYQTAAPGKAFGQRLVAQVQDQHGHPLAGHRVGFTVTAGPARFRSGTSASATTDARGRATAPALTAGRTVGPVAVQAQSGSVTGLFVAAVAARPVEPADVAVKITAPSKVKVGKTFRTKVTVSNRGPGRARDTLVVVAVPSRLSIRSDGPGQRIANVVLYRVSAVEPGRQRTFTLKLRARSAGGAKIVATGMSAVPDPKRGNNTDTDTVKARR